jgi:predicted transcriptional regulator
MRALLARELTDTCGLKQEEAAELLGITQTAVSKYVHKVRGSIIQLSGDEITASLSRTAQLLADGHLNRAELALRMCEMCRLIRQARLMCRLCTRDNPSFKPKECFVCPK